MGRATHCVICAGARRGSEEKHRLTAGRHVARTEFLLDCPVCVSKDGVVFVREEQALVMWQLCELGDRGLPWCFLGVRKCAARVCVFVF